MIIYSCGPLWSTFYELDLYVLWRNVSTGGISSADANAMTFTFTLIVAEYIILPFISTEHFA
jgi:hypothetical protein